MADYFDYQGMNSGHLEAGPSSFVRPLNLADRQSGHTTHSASNASGLTYATNGSAPVLDENQESPAEPIRGMPTPVMPPKGLRLSGEYDDEDDEDEEDEDTEYMMVDADLSMVSQFGGQIQPPSLDPEESPQKVIHNKPVPVKVQGGRKGFVGGFVSGLRRLPKLLRTRSQTVHRQPSHDTVLELPGFGEDSPGYDPFRAQPPPIPHHMPLPQHAPSVPASHQVTSMHYSHYTHEELSESPGSRDPQDFDFEDDQVDHGHSPETDEDEDQHSTHNQSAVAHSTRQSARHSARHSALHSNRPSILKSNQNPGHQPNQQTPHPSPPRTPAPSRPQTALDEDTTLIHQTQNGEPEVVVVHPLPTSDYKSMPPATSPPSSSAMNVNRIQKFVNDVYNLPWVATNVTVDYVPERDGRRYRGMDPTMKKIPKPMQSWYPSTHKDLDLLAEESLPQSAPVMAHRRQDGHRRALTESTVTPTSTGITQSVTPSTGTFSNTRRYSVNSEPTPRHGRHTRDFRHSHRHRRRHRDHSRPHSPPIYPVLASPQPLYFYPGHGTPPMMPIAQTVLGSPSPSSRSRRGITSPGMPVYMIPVPPPVYQPMSGFPHAGSQPAHSQPASNPPTSA